MKSEITKKKKFTNFARKYFFWKNHENHSIERFKYLE